MLHLPSSFKNGHLSAVILIFGSTRPSTTLTSSSFSSSCVKFLPVSLQSLITSSGSRMMELPIPVQQAWHPLHSSQYAFTISFASYNLPSEISSSFSFLIIAVILNHFIICLQNTILDSHPVKLLKKWSCQQPQEYHRCSSMHHVKWESRHI